MKLAFWVTEFQNGALEVSLDEPDGLLDPDILGDYTKEFEEHADSRRKWIKSRPFILAEVGAQISEINETKPLQHR